MRRWRGRRAVAVIVGLVVGCMAVLVGPGIDAQPVDADLATLLSLPDDEIDEFLVTHEGVIFALLDEHPDEVAEWWGDLGDTARAALIASNPAIVGNLHGVDYASRDEANRARLADRLDAAGKATAAHPDDTRAALLYAALSAIHGATKGTHDPERHLVQLTDDVPPLASVAVGDLDTAQQVTFAVPGMGTYSTDMQLWTVAAENIHRAQGRAGASPDRAVVAWIGYEVPPPGLDATEGSYAARGAPRLSSDILALRAARKGTGLDTVSVIAHSYGTTTAANALAASELDVFSFVMLGSAGVEYRVGSVRSLSAAHVYAGEAAADDKAFLGRVARIDPRTPSFGAMIIGTDGDPSRGLVGVTGHEPVLHSSYNDDPTSKAWTTYDDPVERENLYREHMRSFGYLDTGTESLENAARASSRPVRVPGTSIGPASTPATAG
ncbi:alpha/beta hydrolase [Herbiconiux sp. A18JL235]|uniref:Alpha/beta hydrolase n=1 Tax=Herbiconiux sp. A18JL235 TaxID=3152363 RepID=A0AB39BC89_9MICO